MSCFSARRFLVFVLLLGLAGCGPLPRPFKDANGQGAESPIDAIRDSTGVVVAPVEGAPAAFAGPLADMLVEELARMDIPATSGGALKDAFLLEGFTAPPEPGGNIIIDWRLTDETGTAIKAFSTRHAISPGKWLSDDAVSLREIAAAVATAISNTLQGPAATAQPLRERQRPALAVIAVEGAPGDGNSALKTAFEAVLRRAGLPVTEDPGQALIHIFGNVAVSPVDSGKENLSVTWTLREPDGTEIGVLTQSNKVPQGTLEAKWGPLAYDITTAIVDGIVRVLQVIDDAEQIRRR